MVTIIEVKAGLDAIADIIRQQQAVVKKAKTNAAAASAALAAIPADFSDVIGAINGYTPTGAFESLAKDEKEKLIAEFQALKVTADNIAAA